MVEELKFFLLRKYFSKTFFMKPLTSLSQADMKKEDTTVLQFAFQTLSLIC